MKTILLVEDDADLFSLLKYNITKAGYNFAGTQTGKGVLDLCHRLEPDLILLDIMLPDSDGIEICKAIRRDAGLAGIPIVFLTARASEADRAAGIDAGADDYVVKPFAMRELIERLARHLGAHGAGSSLTVANSVSR